MNCLKLLTIVSISIWLGAIFFFSGLVAPLAFSVLERESAVRLVNAAFPRYYLFGLGLGLLALVGVVGRFRSDGAQPWGPLALVLLMLGMTAFILFVLLPQFDAVRTTLGGRSPAFARLHAFSVALNLVTMLAGLALVVVEGLRLRP